VSRRTIPRVRFRRRLKAWWRRSPLWVKSLAVVSVVGVLGLASATDSAEGNRTAAGLVELPQDPRFNTCKEAKANGYGSYRQGVDPEYAWYDDRDNDGVVCE
jgi:hypothetical protein